MWQKENNYLKTIEVDICRFQNTHTAGLAKENTCSRDLQAHSKHVLANKPYHVQWNFLSSDYA